MIFLRGMLVWLLMSEECCHDDVGGAGAAQRQQHVVCPFRLLSGAQRRMWFQCEVSGVCVWIHTFMYEHTHVVLRAGVYVCMCTRSIAAVAAARGGIVAAVRCLSA